MISTYKYQGLTWVDLESPREDEILHVLSEFGVPEHLAYELSSKTILSKVETYQNMAYLVLHFPRRHSEKNMPDLEIDFIIGRDFIITAHYEFSNTLHNFAKNLEVEVMLSERSRAPHAGYLFHAIILEAYKQAGHKLDDLYQMLEGAKEEIFNNQEDRMVGELSKINREILDFKQALRFHDGIFQSLERVSTQLFGAEFQAEIESLRSELQKISGILDGHRELLSNMRETNDSLLAAKTNKTMRILTVMSFTTFPLVLFATIVLIAVDMGLMHTPQQFAYSVLLTLLLGLFILLHFKHRKWMI